MADAAKPTVAVKLGSLTITGPAALLVLLLMLVALVALVWWATPPIDADTWPLWTSGLIWIAFIVNWSIAARNAAPTASSESAGSRRVHSLLLDTAILLGYVRFAPLDRAWRPAGLGWIQAGLLMQVLFALFAVWARRHLGRNWSVRVETKVDHQLVRTGPYRILRHPIYTGMLGMIAGTALVSGEWHGLLAVALMAVAYARKIPMEERRMREAFGLEWEKWRSVTWAVLPGVV